MSTLKCNICGKTLESADGAALVVCPVCGAVHRVKVGDPRISPEISPAEAERLKRERQAETERRKAARRGKNSGAAPANNSPETAPDTEQLEAIYNRATGLIPSAASIADFREIAELLQSVSGYKQADTLAEKCLARIRREEEAAAAEEVPEFNIGDTCLFGRYPQSAGASAGEDIEWLILDNKGTSLLLLSKYALDCRPYHSQCTDVTWERCDLRAWLNSTFMDNAFTYGERAMIVPVTPSADNGDTAKDKLFLLSRDEVSRYFPTEEERECKPTDYAKAAGAYVDEVYNPCCFWWLRRTDSAYGSPDIIDNEGESGIGKYEIKADDTDIAVRPALWLDLEYVG